MPDGAMTVKKRSYSLPGHEDCGTIEVTYNFRSGVHVRVALLKDMYVQCVNGLYTDVQVSPILDQSHMIWACVHMHYVMKVE